MGSTSGDTGSGVGEIDIMCLGFHCIDDDLRDHLPLRFLPHAWIVIVLGNIMGYRSNLVVLGIISVIFLLPIPSLHG